MRTLYLLALTVHALAWIGCASAPGAVQNGAVEGEIRRLEQAEVEAILQKDIATLETLWAEDFTVNNPRGAVSHGRNEVIALIRSGVIDYSSFDREIETVQVRGNTVIVMGSERLVPAGTAPSAGQTVERRFTNIWMKTDGRWRQAARHANVISPR